MLGRYRYTLSLIALFALSFLAVESPLAAQTPGTITGQITDETGASIPAAYVTVLKAGAVVKSVQTNEQGVFTVPGVPAGNYSLRVTHVGFTDIESKVQLAPGQRATFNTQLKLQAEVQSVTVQADAVGTVSVDASQNANALVLKQAEIDALPDDPDDLASDLQQLAGPSAGPNGGQIYIDGFTGGRLPPKESIREIRINQNPYSAEYDKLGYGRIEILTKPGFDKWHGQALYQESNNVFNARNPFLTETPDFDTKYLSGGVGGPLNKRTSFYIDFDERWIDDSGVINTQILTPALITTPFNAAVPTPQRRIDFSPRIDYQLNDTNTLVMKYSFLRNTVQDTGVGGFNLENQGQNEVNYEQSMQATETAVLSPKMINETRFRWLRDYSSTTATTPETTINVASAFTTGGSSTPTTNLVETNYELQNYTSITQGIQSMKFGLRIRSYQVSQNSPTNFLGSFTFAGSSAAPLLDANNQPELDSSGNYILGPETSIEQYRRTLLFEQEGLPMSMIQALGGGASQFSIAGGNPKSSIAELDAGLFFQDDIRLRPNLTVNFGLRYEIQNQISDFGNFAPRFGFAWSPDAKGNKAGKTVIRGGSGIFYDRLAYQYPLNGDIYNGQTLQNYVVTAPDFFPNVPSLSSLSSTAQTIYQIDPHFHAEYNIQTSIGIERALPKNSRIAVNYIDTRGVHMYRTVNINAPDAALGGDRPFGDSLANIYDYQSTGFFRQHQLIVTGNTQIIPAISLFTYYTLGYAKSDTDGISTFPANQYNFDGEYSRAMFDHRNRAFVGGSVTMRYGIRLSPFIFFQSGGPFNITSGDDYLDQSVFTERPSFTDAACGSSPTIVCNAYGKFNTVPAANEAIIPRNYGNGPSLFAFNLRFSKTWGFGESTRGAATGMGGGGSFGGGPGGGGGGSRGGGGGPRGGGGPGGMFGDASTGRKYNLTLTAEARNLFNNVNLANPIGVITSPLFGTSNAISNTGPGGSNAENRRLTFGIRFAF